MSRSKKSDTTQRDLKIMLKYMVGMNVDKIAKQEKVSKTTIYKVIKANNIPLKQEKEVREYFRRRVFTALMKEGKSVKQISADMGIPEAAVNGYINFEYSRINKEKSNRKDKKLGVKGLASKIGRNNKEAGMVISKTVEEKKRLEEFKKNERKISLAGFNFQDINDNSDDKKEQLKMVMLRELLRYASTVTGIPDYSNDSLLISDYLLPVDIIVMKDMSARIVSGESIESIAIVHRTDEELVRDLIENGIDREEFKDRFIKSLVRRGVFNL